MKYGPVTETLLCESYGSCERVKRTICSWDEDDDGRTGMVRAAKVEELKELDPEVLVGAGVQGCRDKNGVTTMGVMRVDVDEGFGVHQSRIVAKDSQPSSRVNDEEEFFTAGAPLQLVIVDIRNVNLSTSCKTKSTWSWRSKGTTSNMGTMIAFFQWVRAAARSMEREYSETLDDAGITVFGAMSGTFLSWVLKLRTRHAYR